MSRARAVLLLATLAVLCAPIGEALALAPGASSNQLETAGGEIVRQQPQIRVGQPPVTRLAAWSSLVRHVGPRWVATWDRATSVPRRIYGEGLAAPGSIASADAAAVFARAFLARHIDLLAPGSGTSDFVLVSNRVDRGVRVVGFEQRHQGLRVHSGQVSFRFKNDRLVVIGSEALPHVNVAPSSGRLAPAVARATSISWLYESAATTVDAGEPGDAIILPLVANDRVIGFKTVIPVTVSTTGPHGRWSVYIDASSGARVARRQTLHFADANVFFNAPVRLPSGERQDFAVPNTAVIVDGLDVLTNTDGTLTWSGADPAPLTLRTIGQQVDVVNQSGPDDTGSFNIADGGSVTWDTRTDELVDAQITTYVHTNIVKDFVRPWAPTLDFLDDLQIANVNINDECNAFSDGTTINFFQGSTQCANTARLPDVIYHEFGHSFHSHSVIDGVGFFNSAHSEGLSDYLAATITNDPAMGRGFFNSDAPLRHIDPTGMEHRWPDDVAGPHFTGLIFSGAMWDLRKMMIQKLGEPAGPELVDRLFYATLQRATDIPSTYVEVLLEDDDDGNLANGTPNACDINAAFGPHGLRNLDIQLSPLSAELPEDGGYPVSARVSGLFESCPGDQVTSVVLGWQLEGTDEPDVLEAITLTETDGEYNGVIPSIPEGNVVRYQVAVSLADLSTLTFPDNAADRLYQFYVGELVDLYCTSFDTDPFEEGWTSGPDAASDDWEWGAILSPSAAGDPPAPFTGAAVLGNDLGLTDGNGKYQSDKTNFVLSPTVDVGQYTDVRLQYRRWLNVEDGFFDRAAIFVNGSLSWQNLNSDQGSSSALHHEDREWRFHDVAVSQFAVDKKVQLRFEMQSDAGLELGGWTIDDLCLVANVNSVCGDGNVTGAELCDDATANSDTAADACRTDCRAARCGDGVEDSGEQCDDGNTITVDDCSNACTLNDDGGCGCQSASPGERGALVVFTLLGLALGFRRRRQRR